MREKRELTTKMLKVPSFRNFSFGAESNYLRSSLLMKKEHVFPPVSKKVCLSEFKLFSVFKNSTNTGCVSFRFGSLATSQFRRKAEHFPETRRIRSYVPMISFMKRRSPRMDPVSCKQHLHVTNFFTPLISPTLKFG